MLFTNSTFYFETSAVNFLADKFTWQDAIATKQLQKEKSNRWLLSPVTLWEMILTSDESRREEIIFYCQNLFDENLLMSPSEIIIQYLKDDCPINQNYFNLNSNSEIAQVWKLLCRDTNRTFVIDHNEFKDRMKVFQKLSKQMGKLISNINNDTPLGKPESALKEIIEVYSNHVLPKDNENPEYKNVIKLSLLFILYILCLEGDLDSTPQKEYWNEIGIDNTLDRFTYLLERHEDLVFRGPIFQMAVMTFHQTSEDQKPNRGLYMDCLHSIYLTYNDLLITNDDHFKSLREKDLHPNFKNILHISEMEFLTIERKIKV